MEEQYHRGITCACLTIEKVQSIYCEVADSVRKAFATLEACTTFTSRHDFIGHTCETRIHIA